MRSPAKQRPSDNAVTNRIFFMANTLTQIPELSASRNFTPFGAGEFDRENASRPMQEPQRAGWTGEKGQNLVAISERMRSAARMDDIRAETTQRAVEDQMTKNVVEQESMIGPKVPKNEYEYSKLGTSHRAPGYLFQNQVPPTSGAASMQSTLSPKLRSL